MLKQNSGYGTWTLLYNKYKKDYEVVQILKYNQNLLENKDLEFFTGTYEKAREYFLGNENRKSQEFNKEKVFERFIMSISYYQTEEKCVTRMTSEIFEKLIKLCTYKKYWVPENLREDFVFDCLEEAKRLKLLKDEKVKEWMIEKDSESAHKRLYKQEKFEKDYFEKLSERGLL